MVDGKFTTKLINGADGWDLYTCIYGVPNFSGSGIKKKPFIASKLNELFVIF